MPKKKEVRFFTMALGRLLKSLVVVLMLTRAIAMNVDWIPNEENAPLPLSSSYRAALRKLCVLIASGQRLPPEVVAKQDVLRAQCRKLDDDDENVGGSDKVGGGLKLSATVAAIGLAIYAGTSSNLVQDILLRIKEIFGGRSRHYGAGRKVGSDLDSDRYADELVKATLKASSSGERGNMEAIRAARLAAFEKKQIEVLAPTGGEGEAD